MNFFSEHKILAFLVFITICSQASAALSGTTWAKQTVSKDQTFNLTADIKLTGRITIASGVTLTIQNNTTTTRTIKNQGATSLYGMFLVNSGGKLIIKGVSGRIIIDGGANFSDPTYSDGYIKSNDALKSPSKSLQGPAIEAVGDLELSNVTIQNVNNTNGKTGNPAGAILHNGSGTTTINNCTILKCKSCLASAVMAGAGKDGAISIKDTDIYNCVTWCDDALYHCGAVRGSGSTKTHLTMTGVSIHHCFANIDGGAVYWPANGKNKNGSYATLTMDGCDIYNNFANKSGGGMDICASINFINNVSQVHNNHSGTYGGGICFHPYTSGDAPAEPLNVQYNINNFLSVFGNDAPKGGGIAFYVTSDGSSLKANTTFSININGATVSSNRATSTDGGGIWLENEYTGGDYTFTFTISSGTINGNTAAGKGGGIMLSKWVIASDEHATNPLIIYGNTATSDGGGFYITGTSKYDIYDGKIYSNTSSSGSGGGVFVNDATVKVTTIDLYGNKAAGSGGGLYVGSGDVTIGNGIVGKSGGVNEAGENGGGIYVNNGKLTINGGDFCCNKAAKSGGGLYVNLGDVSISSGTIGKSGNANEALCGNGGGIYVNNGKLTIGGGNICYNNAYKKSDNTLGCGGGLYVNSGDITLTGGNIQYNSAERNGGGLYKTSTSTLKIEGGSFTGNTADLNGGGIFSDGTGGITIVGGSIKSNEAANDGGGLYQTGNVTVSISGSVDIENNESINGAGMYIDGGTVTYKNGTMSKNIASGDGGAILLRGGSVEFTGNISNNTAKNGGGLFLSSGAFMTFKGGIITKNNAIAPEGTSVTTAYHGGSGIAGCGGGIYMKASMDSGSKTSLLFELPVDEKVFGLYSNTAEKAGDDIVAEGGNTSVSLPKISEMTLIGFEGQDASPSWFQDYFTGDTGYYQSGGHAVAGDVTKVDRYRNLVAKKGAEYLEHRIPETRLSQIVNNYLCITLSFSMLDITLKATGLLGHETAMFKLVRHGTDKNTRYDILLRADDGASKTLKNMPWGTYSVIPNNEWHREYDPVEPKENIRVGETNYYLIEYNMHHKNAAAMPQHDERQIQGKSVPSSTIEGEKPEKYNGSEL